MPHVWYILIQRHAFGWVARAVLFGYEAAAVCIQLTAVALIAAGGGAACPPESLCHVLGSVRSVFEANTGRSDQTELSPTATVQVVSSDLAVAIGSRSLLVSTKLQAHV